MPDEESLRSFYASQEAAKCQYNFPEGSIRKHARRLFRWIHQAKPPPGFLLDVGCGRGVHLDVAREFGWEVIGVDDSPIARNICERRGQAVYEGLNLVVKRYGETAFDVITLWEVIEHSPDPWAFLTELRHLLKHHGVLALSTPNFNSIVARSNFASWHELRPPMHLHYFTPGSVKKLLEECGFHVLNQLTYASYSAFVDRGVDRVAGLLSLSESAAFLVKVACYKFAKPYFDHKLQSKLEGLGLLTMASPSEIPIPRLRKYFYF
ncbi:MAG: class I SAM-dependent methyltransferase [Nitrososphaera sp.]